MKQSLRWEAAWCEHAASSERFWRRFNHQIRWSHQWWGGASQVAGLGVSASAINTGKDSVKIHGPSAVWRLVEDTRK